MKNQIFDSLIIYPSNVEKGIFRYGLEEDVTDAIGNSSSSYIPNIKEIIENTFEQLDLSLTQAFCPHMEEIDILAESIYDLFERYEDDDRSGEVKFLDGWKWSEGGEELSYTSINSVLFNTNLFLEKISIVNRNILNNFTDIRNKTSISFNDDVNNLNEPLKEVQMKYVIAGFLTDEEGKLTLAPKKPEVTKFLAIKKANVDNIYDNYKKIVKILSKIRSEYDKVKNRFMSIKDMNKFTSFKSLTYALNVFSNVIGSFILIKKLSGLEVSNLLMSIKKNMKDSNNAEK